MWQVVMAGDQVVSAHCRRGSNSRTGERVWEDSGHPDSTLLASCTRYLLFVFMLFCSSLHCAAACPSPQTGS